MAAERGAHLTSTTTTAGDGQDVPSIFEVLAQENLMTSLRPAIKHVARVIAERNPARYGWILLYNDEIYTLLDFILQRHYLKKYSASFGENFYGLKRVMTDGSANLSSSAQRKSLVFLVLFPYVKLKCDSLYERWKERYRTSPGRLQYLRARLVRAFLAVYPIVHSVWESVGLYYQLAYIFGKTRVHSPFLRLAGVALQNLTMEDINSHTAQETKDSSSFHNKSFYEKLYSLLSTGVGGLAIALSSGLSVGVFFLQFLEWWYSSDQHSVSLTALPVPDPPQKVTGEGLPKLPSVCPLCLKFRTNDTALAVSGYVFCYPCIYRHVTERGCCPLTNYPATTDHLVKLYQPDG